MLEAAARLVRAVERLASSKLVRRLLLALAVVTALVTFTNSYDYNVFRHWVIAATLLGILDVYEAQLLLGHVYRVVYPPLAPLLFVGSVYPLVLLKPNVFLLPYPQLDVRILAKAPIVFSVVAGYYVLETRAGERAAKLLVTNPILLLLLTSYFFDIPAAMAATASMLLVEYPLVSGVLLAAATLLKQSFAVLLLPPILYYLRRGDRRGLAAFTLGFAATVAALMAPFLVANGLGTLLYSMLLFHMSRPPQGASIWTIFLVESGYNAEFAMSVSRMWLFFFLALSALSLYATRRLTGTKEGVVLQAALLLTALLATSKVVNPQYTVWLLPLLAALVAYGLGDERLIALFNIGAAMAILYPTLSAFAGAVLHAPVYIEEERRWLTPAEVEKLVIDSAPEIAPKLISFARSTPILYWLLSLVYHEWRIIEPLMSITYTASMLAIFYLLLRGANARRGGA